jgi:hypothetical protein
MRLLAELVGVVLLRFHRPVVVVDRRRAGHVSSSSFAKANSPD